MYLLTTLTKHAVACYYWEHGELLPEHQGQVTRTDVNRKRALTSSPIAAIKKLSYCNRSGQKRRCPGIDGQDSSITSLPPV